jgi:ketosteroid isomerase-like protein
MSEENMKIVRRIYEEDLIDRDPKRLVEHFGSPEIEYVDPPGDVDSGTRHGRKDVMLAMRRARQLFRTFQHELHGLFDAGDTVIAAVSLHATARQGSKLEDIDKEVAHIWTLRDGKIVRLENGRDLKDALEAAGISE